MKSNRRWHSLSMKPMRFRLLQPSNHYCIFAAGRDGRRDEVDVFRWHLLDVSA